MDGDRTGKPGEGDNWTAPQSANDVIVQVAGHHPGGDEPLLLHKIDCGKSVLCLAVNEKHVFAGTQGNEILVWAIGTYEHVKTLVGHRGSVLCLYLSAGFLWSSSSDSAVIVWDVTKLSPLRMISSVYDIGDIFSLIYSSSNSTLYVGAQNTSLQWIELNEHIIREKKPISTSNPSMPFQRSHKFFDGSATVETREKFLPSTQCVEINPSNIINFAHYGYIFCLLLCPYGSHEILLSGGGDGTVKAWKLDGSIEAFQTLDCCESSILSMHISQHTLLCVGTAEGEMQVWDLETWQVIRRLDAHKESITAMTGFDEFVFTLSAKGISKMWARGFEVVSKWKVHYGIILAGAVFCAGERVQLVTGGNDNMISLWDINVSTNSNQIMATQADDEMLIQSLRKFISYRTIPKHVEDCRRAATFLKNLLRSSGASSTLIANRISGNPVVYGKFSANAPNAVDKCLLFYGHYDVITVAEDEWATDPWILTGLGGYLYGRGVSDNKGPVLAAIFAVIELLRERRLTCDVIFLVEGEEENGSLGFMETIQHHRHVIGDIDWILLSNSYWLDDDVPCLTYGLRGIIHATVRVYNHLPDLHSGVDGGLSPEPIADLIRILAKLRDHTGGIALPGFYDPVRPVTVEEKAFYEAIVKLKYQSEKRNSPSFRNELMSKWRFPSLTIHKIEVSGPSNVTVIPHSCEAALSIRLVPDQNPDEIAQSLISFLTTAFTLSADRHSKNQLQVDITHKADSWLGDYRNASFQTLASAIHDEWGVDPLFIREGGSIPAVRFLEKEFKAEAAHFPCGQASDHAHLNNERMRIINLYKGKNILKHTIERLPLKSLSTDIDLQ